MKSIQKIVGVGVSGLLVTFALALAALTAGTATAASRTVNSAAASAGSAKTLPHTTIKGHPAHFRPSKLSAKARWTTPPICTSTQASFSVTNKENKAELISFTGTNGFTPFSFSIAAHASADFCITKGYHGTLKGKLSDHKKLTVGF